MNLSSETINSGKKANKTGKTLEVFVERLLQDNGYQYLETPDKKQCFTNRKTIEGKKYSTQVPCGTSIYETYRKCDFIVMNKDKFKNCLIIECKWQQSSGSVDEKYPFTVLNIFKIKVPTIILLDGGGYKKGAMEWLKSQVIISGYLIGVYTMQEFTKKVNNGFLG